MNHENDHIEDPKLTFAFKSNTNHGFKLPSSYFDTLTERVMDQVEKKTLPEELKTNVFKTPVGYFDSFSDRLMKKILELNTSKHISTSFNRMRIFSAAAAVILVLSLFIVYVYKIQNPVDYLADISEEELLEYVSLHATDFDRFSLAYVMSEEDLKAIDIFDEMDEEATDVLIELYQ